MKTDYVILGADGQQGIIASRYMRSRANIVCCDIYFDNLKRDLPDVQLAECDHRDRRRLQELLCTYQPRVVINCANDFYNDAVTDACLKAGSHCVDLGSDIEGTMRRLARHDEFKAAGLTYIMGCGSVPGIGSVMLRSMAERFDTLESAEAGFAWDSNRHDFVPPFFLFVVLLELSRPAEVMKDGAIQYVPPMSEYRDEMFPMIGKQRLFMVPHSEVATFHHYYKHKGLRDVRFWAGFPEHSRRVIDALIRAGMNSDKPVRVVTERGAVDVTPCDFLTAAAKRIPTPDGYTESEVLWAEVKGTVHGTQCSARMECHVPPLDGWEHYGCNVDTAFPACAVAEMVRSGEIEERGVFCPEGIVPADSFIRCMKGLGFTFLLNGSQL